MGPRVTLAVSNNKVRIGSRITLIPGNLADASALPILMTIGETTFTIQSVNSGASEASYAGQTTDGFELEGSIW